MKNLHVAKTKLQKFAEEKLIEHGCSDWAFTFSRGKRQVGWCNGQTKEISLSSVWVNLNGDHPKMYDTILHEIAHILAMRRGDYGHGRIWKQECRRVGAKPERVFDIRNWPGLKSPEGKYKLVCDVHGVVGYLHRRPTLKRSCYECSPGKFSYDHVLKVELT